MKFFQIKQIISVGYGDLFGTIISGIFWFVIAKMMSPENFGELNYFVSIATISGLFSTFSTLNTTTVFSAKKIPITSTLLLISIISGFLFSLILFIIYNRLDIGFLALGYTINFIISGYLLGQKKFKKYSNLILIQKCLVLFLGLTFYLLLGDKAIIFSLAATYIPFIGMSYLIFKNEKINFKLIKKKFSFITENYISQLIGGLSGQVDKLVIFPIFGTPILGNYSLSLIIIGLLMILPNMIFRYVLPHDASNEKLKNEKLFLIIISIILSIISAILLPKILPIFFPQFTTIVEIIPIISLSMIPQAISSIFESRLLSLEKSRSILFTNIFVLISFIITIILLGSLFGLMGIAYSLLFTVSIRSISLYSFLKKIKA